MQSAQTAETLHVETTRSYGPPAHGSPEFKANVRSDPNAATIPAAYIPGKHFVLKSVPEEKGSRTQSFKVYRISLHPPWQYQLLNVDGKLHVEGRREWFPEEDLMRGPKFEIPASR